MNLLFQHIKLLWNDLTSLFLPARCLACGTVINAPEYYICQNCLKKHPKHSNARPNYFSLLEYSGLIQKLVWHLKYDSRPEIGEYLGRFLAEELLQHKLLENTQNFIIIPVPLHPKRQRKRGYNQSDKLAKGMAEIFNCRYAPDFITRNTNNVSQTLLNKNERGKNVQNIFSFGRSYPPDSCFLIIDDVITTGATTREMLKLLRDNGYPHVLAISLAAPAIAKFQDE